MGLALVEMISFEMCGWFSRIISVAKLSDLNAVTNNEIISSKEKYIIGRSCFVVHKKKAFKESTPHLDAFTRLLQAGWKG